MRPFGSINACNEQCNANLNSVALYQNSTVFSECENRYFDSLRYSVWNTFSFCVIVQKYTEPTAFEGMVRICRGCYYTNKRSSLQVYTSGTKEPVSRGISAYISFTSVSESGWIFIMPFFSLMLRRSMTQLSPFR